jgi:hypothetical protein
MGRSLAPPEAGFTMMSVFITEVSPRRHVVKQLRHVVAPAVLVEDDDPMKRSAALLICLLGLALMPAPATAHKAPNSCGHQTKDGAGWYRAYGHEVGCKKTREVARAWSRRCLRKGCPTGESVSIYVHPGYSCDHRKWGYESVRVECHAEGNRTVHFLWGS